MSKKLLKKLKFVVILLLKEIVLGLMYKVNCFGNRKKYWRCPDNYKKSKIGNSPVSLWFFRFTDMEYDIWEEAVHDSFALNGRRI